ncbi:MAG: HAD family hydrolase [Oscillospiraceae bacterium]|jgi:putative hydrolase of the HAD superfamily|nr:HAD family hydrolase [Oscillospiraceae bacterium]
MQNAEIVRPKMVLFDFGHTLMAEPDASELRAAEALLRHCVKNPQNLHAEDIQRFCRELWRKFCRPAAQAGREVQDFQFQRLRSALLGLEFSLSPQEQELVFWEAYTPVAPMPHIEELLAFLEARGIRKGVVSNISFSGETLAARLAKGLPGYDFEFVIASSDYGVRKPDPLIFQVALAKAGLEAGDAWFCGDSPSYDIEGAHAAGMRAVWYDDRTVDCLYRDPAQEPPACPHVHIHGWRELIDILKETQ